jgi:hypothetical protein
MHVVAAAACLVWIPSVAFAGTEDKSAESASESHTVRDSLVTGANKVGEVLKSGAEKVGPAIDHGVAVTKKTVEKSAHAVGAAVKETSNKIEQKVSGKSDDDKPPGSHSK